MFVVLRRKEAAERALGTVGPRNAILVGRELRAPGRVGFEDFRDGERFGEFSVGVEQADSDFGVIGFRVNDAKLDESARTVAAGEDEVPFQSQDINRSLF